MRLADLGEFGLIERIRQATGADPAVRLGIGDDCAAWEVPPGRQLLVTSDLLLEGVHFRRDWVDWELLGRKSVSVNLSDIAAMGGVPGQLILGLGLPADLEIAQLDRFFQGFLQAAAENQVSLVGGDTCRAQQFLTISVTALGSVAPDQLVTRSGAQVDDRLFVSGTLGDSALALRELLAQRNPEPFLANRHHNPTARVALGQALARQGLARAMIDLSDGLLADLGHILEASETGAAIQRDALPLSGPFKTALARDPSLWELALAGGEDYELLFAVPPASVPAVEILARDVGTALTCIGRVTAKDSGLKVFLPDGGQHRSRSGGFNHFQR